MATKKTWREKLLDSKDLPKVVPLGKNARKHWKGETMAIPSPMEVNEIMRRVPKGNLITLNEIRKIVAQKHTADIGCPLTCGIFSWIAAHAAAEEAEAGKKKITPYWRTLKTGGEVNPKYPGGVEEQQRLLESEGHKVVQKGRKILVDQFETKLMQA
jgi:alkylated DNA nucleotide flippase Atl1